MTVNQVIDLAKNGELKNIAVREDTIAVLGFLNLGLIELYKRFPLNTKEVIITLGSDGTIDDPYTMISDTIYEMPDDYMYILEAYQEVPAHSNALVSTVSVNDEDDPLSINTVSWNRVQIPVTTTGSYISLIYAGAPTYLTITDVDERLELPPQLLNALLQYIGYQGHASVNPNQQESNNTYYQRFEVACSQAETLGVITSDSMNMNTRLNQRGFL